MDATKAPGRKSEGRDLGDEYLIYDREADKVHVLNATAREIYLLCDGERSVDAIAAEMQTKYGIEADLAERDTRQTLEDLDSLGVLNWSG